MYMKYILMLSEKKQKRDDERANLSGYRHRIPIGRLPLGADSLFMTSCHDKLIYL